MNALSFMKSVTNVETAIIVMFILYLALPVELPDMLANLVDSPMGTIGIFVLSVYLFFNANPLIAVLFVLVAYELFRRSSNATGKAAMIKYTPTQARKDEKMKKMNPVKTVSLEEEVVEQMAPVGKSDISVFTVSTFKPVAENVGSASMF
jgi:hypothetical protein